MARGLGFRARGSDLTVGCAARADLRRARGGERMDHRRWSGGRSWSWGWGRGQRSAVAVAVAADLEGIERGARQREKPRGLAVVWLRFLFFLFFCGPKHSLPAPWIEFSFKISASGRVDQSERQEHPGFLAKRRVDARGGTPTDRAPARLRAWPTGQRAMHDLELAQTRDGGAIYTKSTSKTVELYTPRVGQTTPHMGRRRGRRRQP